MKKLIYIIATFLIIACSSKDDTIKRLKSNVKSYQNLKYTKALTLKEAAIFLRYEKNRFLISINSKDRDKDIFLNRCLINNKEASILVSNQSVIDGINWLNSYELLFKDRAKKIKLKCYLSNLESFSTTFEF